MHDRAQLGAYAIGALDPGEARAVHEHIGGCLECQREVNELMVIRRALDQVPPEAFLDGPPANGDLLLRRTLRRVTAEAAPPPRRSVAAVVITAAAAVAIGLGGGIYLGRETAPTGSAQAAPPSTATSTPSNAAVAEATDQDTGTTMNVAVEPKKGWVWVHANVTGLKAGLHCQIWVVPKEGPAVLAGGWTVSADGEKSGTRLEGTADVDPAAVKAVEIRTVDEDVMVSVPISS